ncbi:MAG: hypothetical protein LBB94_10050 [Clostridiales bacterium]|jgi:hypothetical protein|nr:hypothetical protein [Clostridiales bacterium]
MRFYHTFWSRPALESNRWAIKGQYYMSLIHTALSVAYMKLLGQEIVLYTDTAGKALLDCLPYDVIYTTLDSNRAPIVFWASGKFHAMKAEPVDSVHIDTDFWVKSDNILNVIRDNPVVFPHRELTTEYTGAVKAVTHALNETGTQHTFTGAEKKSINMGLIKLDNPTLRNAFIHHYWRLMHGLIQSRRYMYSLSNPQGGSINSPDLVIEQLLMTKLLEQTNVKPKFLIPLSGLEYTNTKEIGFCHLLAYDKYLKIPEELKRLKELDKKIYIAVLKRYEDMRFNLLNLTL